MSFNRGVKRNSFGNRSFGNRSGSGGGGSNSGLGAGMGSIGGGGSGSRGMNPWESGVMPGRGILPTPSNNLSLNSPQAQLVIASNLLSNLLRTQQDPQPQVPSLLSLGNNMNGPGANYRGQQNFSSGRFNDRQMRTNVKNQRPQPYKMGNRARDSVAGRRGPSAQQSRAQSQSGNQRINGNQNQHRNDKASKANPASKQNQTSKKEQQDVKTSDNEKADTQPIAKSELKENDTEEKKDEEKKDGEETLMEINESEEKSATDSTQESAQDGGKTSSLKKSDETQGSGKKSEARHAESRYAAVPISHMFCHVCTKHMWDGFSFENHLRGRAHQLMMEKLDESYKLRVDFMRHELKVSEEQRELSLHNSKRRGKKVSVDLSVREYCTMCDLHFYGTLSSHRKSEKHQQLKIFLHPRCSPCAKEFPSRIEYDEHCLTPTHMVHAAQNEEQKKTKKNKLAKGESEIRTAEDEEKDIGIEVKANEKDDELPENTEFLFDIIEGIDMTKFKVPSFKHCRQHQVGLGASLVKEVQGYHCEKCRRFMLSEEDMNAHLRTLTHYKNFVTEVKLLTAPAASENNTKESGDKTAQEEGESKASDDHEQSAKRRKLEDSVADELSVNIKEEVLNTTLEDMSGNESVNKDDETDKYDPLEADAEVGDGFHADKENETNVKDENNCEQPMEVWGDGDNDNEPEVGNLLDDDVDIHEEKPIVQSLDEKKSDTVQPSSDLTNVQVSNEEQSKNVPEEQSVKSPQISQQEPPKSPQVSQPQPAKSPQVAQQQPAKTPQVPQPQPTKSPQVSQPPPAKSPQVSQQPAPKTPQISQPQPVKSPQVSQPQPAQSPQVVQQQPAKSPQASQAQVAKSPQVSQQQVAKSPQVSQQQPTNSPQLPQSQAAKTPQAAQQQSAKSPQVSQQQPAKQLQSTPVGEMAKKTTPTTPNPGNNSHPNTPNHNKSPRGRGGFRGRGHQRARRSRR